MNHRQLPNDGFNNRRYDVTDARPNPWDRAAHAMHRINVIGSSGCGKTTFARALAKQLDAPHHELDATYHQRDWVPLEAERFREAVARFTAAERWVVDGNYSMVGDIVWGRADTVIFLDLPRAFVMWRLFRRTLRRLLTREVLWNGNREPIKNFLSLDPNESIFAWSWTRHRLQRERYDAALKDPAYAHVDFVRLTSAKRARRFLAQVARA